MKERKTKLKSARPIWQRFLMVALMVVSSMLTFAQGRVSGTVADASGEPVIGASVVVKGTGNGTVTDFDGRFTIANVPASGSLEISYIGFKTQTVTLGGKAQLSITLQEDRQLLDEVVVVGYGVQKKSDVTGAMASVT